MTKTDRRKAEKEGTPWRMVAGSLSGEGNEVRSTLDEVAREGARRMIAAALEAEVGEYVARFGDDLDEDGHRLVVRNGKARERRVTVGAGSCQRGTAKISPKGVLAAS